MVSKKDIRRKMGKVEKITIKLAMLFIGLSLLFPARVLAAEKNEINEITEKSRLYFCWMQANQCRETDSGLRQRTAHA